MEHRWWARTCAVMPLAAGGTALIGWWWVGDLSTAVDGGAQGLDHLLRAPELSIGSQRMLAGLGAAIAAAATVSVVVLVPRRRLVRWLALLAAWVLLGLVLGWAARVLTAGVIGANIGGGLVLIGLGPVVLAVLAVLIGLMWRGRPRRG